MRECQDFLHVVLGELAALESYYVYAVIEFMARGKVVCKPRATIALFWCQKILHFRFWCYYWLFALLKLCMVSV